MIANQRGCFLSNITTYICGSSAYPAMLLMDRLFERLLPGKPMMLVCLLDDGRVSEEWSSGVMMADQGRSLVEAAAGQRTADKSRSTPDSNRRPRVHNSNTGSEQDQQHNLLSDCVWALVLVF